MNTRVYRQLAVWRFVRKHQQGVTRRDLIEKFKLTPYAASNIMQRMAHYGYVYRSGSTRHALWFATDKRPEDQRGCHPNSKAGLEAGAKQWDAGLKAAAVKRGRNPDNIKKDKVRPVVYEPATELERCWSMPFSRTQPARDESKYAGEVASAENVKEPA